MEKNGELKIGKRQVKLSHLDKVLFPETGFTKADLVNYYIKISRYLLPHLKGRPVTLKRYPEGIRGDFFYEKEAPAFTPAWVKTANVWRVSGESQIRYIMLNDLPSLVWSANIGNIELHTFLARFPRIEKPTMLVFDLDPGPPAGVLECAQVALWLRDLLEQLGLKALVKASGSKGLHFCVPLNTAVTYEQTQPLAQGLASLLERQHPELIVSEMSKQLREGKVFIDWSQNVAYKTTVCVYSLRGKREQPSVSVPLQWSEVERALKQKDADAFFIGPEEAIRRCEKMGDLFEPLLTLKQKVPRNLARALDGLHAPPHAPGKRSARSQDLSLEAYRAKRNFSQTSEPPPEPRSKRLRRPADRKAGTRRPSANSRNGARLFVIQKHAASHLHYDFRLEMDGALKSWAVPKGPPYERSQKRLAMQVEDHPLDYARFEGTIPPGNYGAGTVMVWDIGTYEVLDGNVYAGKLHLLLKGKKLQGEWILVRAARDDDQRTWFLIKGGTSMTPLSPKQDDRSVLSRRAMKTIASENDTQWIGNRAASRK